MAFLAKPPPLGPKVLKKTLSSWREEGGGVAWLTFSPQAAAL